MERCTVCDFHSKANMDPLSLLFNSSSNLPLSQVNAILQLLGLGPQTSRTMIVPVSDQDKIKRAACIRFQWPIESEELGS